MQEKIYWFQTKSTGQNFEIYWSDLSDLSHVCRIIGKFHRMNLDIWRHNNHVLEPDKYGMHVIYFTADSCFNFNFPTNHGVFNNCSSARLFMIINLLK